jgi:RNA polymerase sigma factor (sigma-70 family)
LAFIQNIADPSIPDAQLLNAFKQSGDLNYLGTLYARYMELVYGVCLKYLVDGEAAKDATMQVFEELILKVQKHSIDNFRGWLYVLAKNHCLMKLRSSKNQVLVPFDGTFMQSGDNPHHEGAEEKEAQLQLLEACIEKLKDDQKNVIKLFYLQEKCYNDIVTETSLDWNQVRSLVQNGRRNLKICMDKSNAEGEPNLEKTSKE